MAVRRRGGGDNRVDVEIGVNGDTQDAANVAREITTVMKRHFDRAFDAMADDLADALRGAAKVGAKALTEEFRGARGSFKALTGDTEALTNDLIELKKRSDAFKQSLDARGVNRNLFAVYEVEMGKLLRLQERFNAELSQGNLSRERVNEINEQRLLIGKALDKEAQTIRDTLHLERSAMVVETQRAGAQRLAETRIAGQRILQEERQRSRARIELFRAAQRQILFIEKQIADGFRGAARLVAGTLSVVQSGAARVGQVFRRSNRDMNDGLRGALIQRESAISRSFGRQTTEIRTEVTKQAKIIDQFQAQASTGVVGAVTGRSSLGTLLGGGVAIGGGFALFQGLRTGIKIGGDFVQGLAVLQAQLKLTDEEMQEVRAQSIELGNDITLPGVSALDAAQAIQILAKQFASLGEEALPAARNAARGVLQLSRATGVEADEAARVVGSAVNVFGLNANQAVIAADQVTNAITNAAGVGFGDFADSFTQAAGVFNLFTGSAANAGETMAQFNAAIAVLAKNGLVGSDAGTSLKQFLLQANRGTDDAKTILREITAAAEETGSVFFDSAGNARTLADALDILRRGTRDLNDQQLSATLQKLFGSDAARAAAFLIGETTANFEDLVEKIRETGSAADIAAAQNTGLRGALDALQSVIETQQIKTYEKYQEVLGRVVTRFAELLQAFFDGEGKMGILRNALAGIVAVLGGLLVIKAVAEGFQFFALSLQAVATPLGIVVAGLAALGGAVAVLRQISPEFREETNAIADTLRGGLGDGLSVIGDGLAIVSRFLRVEIVPRFVDFSVALARRVLPIVERTVEVVGELGGAFRSGLAGEGVTSSGLIGFMEVLGVTARQASIGVQAFRAALGGEEFSAVLTSAGVLNEERQTAFVRFAERLGEAVRALREALGGGLTGEGVTSTGLVGFAERVGVVMRQAAIGVQAFSAAIQGREFTQVLTSEGVLNEERQTAFVKFFENLGETLRIVAERIAGIAGAIGTALGQGDFTPLRDRLLDAFRDLGDRAIEILGPQLLRITNFLADQFSPRNLERLVLGVAEIVFRIGETLGLIVSDPRFVAALEGIVLAVTAVAGTAIAGFISGIIENLPELGDMLVDQFQFVFNELFKDGIDYKKIAKFFIVGLAAALVVGATITGFVRAFRAPAEKAGVEAAKGFTASMGRQLRVGLRRNDFARVFVGGFEKFAADEAARTTRRLEREQARAAERLRLLSGTTRIGEAFVGIKSIELAGDDAVKRLAAVEQHFGKAATAAGILRGRLKEVFIDIGNIASAVRTSFSATEPFLGIPQSEELRRSIGSLFRNVGRFVAEGVAQLRQAFVGGGQALGGALLSGISAALAGRAAGEAGSAGGAALGLAGVIASALFAASSVGGGPQGVLVGSIVGAIGAISFAVGQSGAAARQAAAEVKEYTDALKDIPGAESGAKATEIVLDNIENESKAVRDILEDVKFNARDFADEVVAGTFTAGDAFDILAPKLGRNADKIAAELIRLENQLGSDFGDSLREAQEALPADVFVPLAELLKTVPKTTNIDNFAQALDALLDESSELREGLADARQFQTFEALAVSTADNARAASERLTEQTKQYQNELANVNIREEILAENRLAARNELLTVSFENVRTAAAELNSATLAGFNAQVSDLTTKLEAARTAAQLAIDNVLSLIGGETFNDPLLSALDNLVLTIPQVANEIQELLAGGADITVTEGPGLPAAARLRAATRPFLAVLQETAKAAIDEGLTSPQAFADAFAEGAAQIESFTIPVETTLEDGTIKVTQEPLHPSVKEFLLDQLRGFLENPNLTTALDELTISQQAEQALAAQLEALQAKLPVSLVFDLAEINAQLKALGLPELNLTQAQLDLISQGFLEPLPTNPSSILGAEANRAQTEARNLRFATDRLQAISNKSGTTTTNETNFNATVNIEATDPVATGSEVTRAFRNLAAGGFIIEQVNARQAAGLPV